MCLYELIVTLQYEQIVTLQFSFVGKDNLVSMLFPLTPWRDDNGDNGKFCGGKMLFEDEIAQNTSPKR